MRRQAVFILHYLLTIVLVVGILISSGSRGLSHNPIDLAAILEQHQSEIEEHGHAHEGIVDITHAYQGHAHEMTDHDHNLAFLPPRRGSGDLAPARRDWPIMQISAKSRKPFGLDRPPRG
ncbi:MAG: hypothetical protein ACJASV_002934 [Pseudorhodobacter sp.]|jgi:hypothetical protein